MKLKIEKPNWHVELITLNKSSSGMSLAQEQWLNEWFHQEVEPINKILAEGVEVSGDVDDFSMSEWRSTKGRGYENNTHKALLINIQPIKKDTAEDVLRDLSKEVICTTTQKLAERMIVLQARAKSVLEQK